MPENILVDTQIMFRSQLDDKLSFLAVFEKKNFRIFFFQKLKNPFLIDLEWSILAKGKVAISKTVAPAASRYKNTHIIIIIIPTEYKNHHKICEFLHNFRNKHDVNMILVSLSMF